MTVLRSLLGRRNLENPAVPITSTQLVNMLDGDVGSHAGVSVSETSALKVPAVWRAVNLIAGQGASLPIKTYRRTTRARTDVRVINSPHPDMTPLEFWEVMYWWMLLWGNAYAQKVRNGLGEVVELWFLPSTSVKVGRVRPDNLIPSGKVFEVTDGHGKKHPFTDRDIFHMPGPGYDGITGCSPIRFARQSVGLALAAEEYGARLFGSGSLMSGILQTEQRLKQDEAERLKARWQQKMGGLSKAHEVAVLDAGAKFQAIGIPPGDAQFIESRRFQIGEVARWFGIPSHLLMDTEKSTSYGTGMEENTTGFVKFSLLPNWLARVEQRITRDLVPNGQYAQYELKGLLRANTAAQTEKYAKERQAGFLTLNGYNELEDKPPVPGGDTYWLPANMSLIDADGTVVVPAGAMEPEPDPEPEPDAEATGEDDADEAG